MKNNLEVKRPLSPHLSIYRPQITSVLSITHRITGVFLFFGFWAICAWVIANAYGCSSCFDAIIGHFIGKVFLILFATIVYYHLFNGIRHLFWDVGKGLNICSVKLSGLLVILATIAASLFTWFSM